MREHFRAEQHDINLQVFARGKDVAELITRSAEIIRDHDAVSGLRVINNTMVHNQLNRVMERCAWITASEQLFDGDLIWLQTTQLVVNRLNDIATRSLTMMQETQQLFAPAPRSLVELCIVLAQDQSNQTNQSIGAWVWLDRSQAQGAVKQVRATLQRCQQLPSELSASLKANPQDACGAVPLVILIEGLKFIGVALQQTAECILASLPRGTDPHLDRAWGAA